MRRGIKINQSKKNHKLNLLIILGILLSTILVFATVQRIKYKQLEKSEAATEENIGIGKEESKPEGIIIKYKTEKTQAQFSSLKKFDREKANPRRISPRIYALDTREEDVEKTIEEIKNEEGNNIEYIEPDYYYSYNYIPNDPLFKDQWYLKKIKAEEAWDINKGKPEVIVAVADSGVALHNDLNSKVIERKNFAGGSEYDAVGHGTMIAGIVAAVTNNNTGIASVGHDTKIISVKVGGKKGVKASDAVEGIRWAADRGVNIITISWEASRSSEALKEAIDYAWNKGVFITAAAGNEKSGKKAYPAAYDHVFSAAATDKNDSKANFSNYGQWVDIAAPGVDILTTDKNGSYTSVSGTSFSAPIVAGVAALVKAKFPNYTNSQIEQKLCDTADKIDKTDKFWKCGRTNAYKALGAGASATPSPTATPTPPNQSNTLRVDIRFQGITSKANYQNSTVEFFQNSKNIYQSSQPIENNENGIYSFYIDNSNQKITPGRYEIRVKGESHLGRKFKNVEIKSINDVVNLTSEDIKAGDINGDNKITITDIAQVLSYYISFSNKVDQTDSKMVQSDINKDGKITIIDVALIALNWSSFNVSGE